jgi:AcrR family transcriptional regulator
MGRTKTVSDADVFQAIRHLLAEGGEKAVAFASVARATGLSGPTLVQRFGSRAGMVQAAHLAAWKALDAATAAAIAGSELSPKGAQNLLKSLGNLQCDLVDFSTLCIDLRDAILRQRAKAWRNAVEVTLGLQLGGGSKGREAAAMLFAAWQGQLLWNGAGGKRFKIKDAVKAFT